MNKNKFQVLSFSLRYLKVSRLLKIALFLILATPLQGQDSLSYYLEIAFKNNPGLQSKYLEYSAALEKVPQNGALPDPTVQLGILLKPMELLGGNQLANFQLMQMFPWFGTLKVAKDEASQMAVMKFEELMDSRNLLNSQVKISWFELYKEKRQIVILNANLELLKTLEKISLSKYTNAKVSGSTVGMASSNTNSTSNNSGGMSGMQGKNSNNAVSASSGEMNSDGASSSMSSKGSGMVDVFRIQMEIAELQNQIAALEDQLVFETAHFNSLLNRSLDLSIAIPDSLSEQKLSFNLARLTDSLKNNPMLKMIIAQKKASEAQQLMANKMGKPMIGLGLNYELIQKREGNTSMMNGKDMIMPMLSISIPFFSQKYKSMEREAGFNIEANNKTYQNTLNNLELALLEYEQKYKDAGRRLLLYQNQASLARTSVNLLVSAYSVTKSDFEEVLRMQAQLLDYGLKELEAFTDINSLSTQIEYLAGINNIKN